MGTPKGQNDPKVGAEKGKIGLKGLTKLVTKKNKGESLLDKWMSIYVNKIKFLNNKFQ